MVTHSGGVLSHGSIAKSVDTYSMCWSGDQRVKELVLLGGILFYEKI